VNDGPPPEQRQVSPVAGRRREATFWRKLCIGGGVAIALVAITWWRGPGSGNDGTQKNDPPLTIGTQIAAPPASYPPDPEAPASNPITPTAATVPAPPGPPPAARTFQEPPPIASPRKGQMIVYGSSKDVLQGNRGAGGDSGSPPGPAGSAAAGNTARGDDTSRVAFKAGTIPGTKAGPAIDLYLTLMPQVIPCVLDTAMDTSVPGTVFCHLPRPAYSPKGVVLMDRLTTVVADYKQLQQGQNAIFTMAGYALTPQGVPVPLDSSMGDELGRAGVPGNIDHHTAERFGGAVLLSVLQSSLGALQSLAQGHGNGNNNFTFNTGTSESVITEVLRSSINIPPSLKKAVGEEVSIVLRNPISFEGAYDLSTIR
jgi:type IV secretion system protein VirB10